MLNIEQFRYGDNLGYLLYGTKEAMAIDSGAWQEIHGFLKKYRLTLKYVTNTHGHFDHTLGDEYLLEKTDAKYLDCARFTDNEKIFLDGLEVVVYRTPGHSRDSVCFHTGDILITGDTLFNGTVGNCFSGDLRGFFNSILRLMALPGQTRVFAVTIIFATRWLLRATLNRTMKTYGISWTILNRIFFSLQSTRSVKSIPICVSTRNRSSD